MTAVNSLKLYDTATRAVRDFQPLKKGEVSMYVCGATVQAAPHVGHIRSGVNFDILRRWLMASGYNVTFIRNVTDIDDKILHKAIHEAAPWWAVAMKYERAFADAYDALNVLPPTYEPRATGHITQMIELLPVGGGRGQRRAALQHHHPAGGHVLAERDLHAAGHRGHRADRRYGGGCQRADLRAHPRGTGAWQVGPGRTRGRLQPGVWHDL